MLCGGVVTEKDIHDNGACPKCAGIKIKPSDLSLWEEIVQICKDPSLLADVYQNIKGKVLRLWGKYVLQAK
jgi:hypothetical protein